MSEEELARRRVMQEAIDTYVINPEDTDSHRVEGHGASMLAAAETQMAYEMTHEAQDDPHQLILYGKSVIALRQYTKEHISRSDFNLTA